MLLNENIIMGTIGQQWGRGTTKTVTFCVTEDCNLRCKYCYMTGKNSSKKMSFNTAKNVVDYVLSNKEVFNEESIIWEFIGGEPFLEIELIDKITDYIKLQMYILNHPWFNSYRISMATNGLLYNTPKVQNYIQKNNTHLSIAISIDGNKIKHDLQRVKIDGSGSYDDVVKNVPLWLKQFPGAQTKATFSHDDLPYLKDSIISLWDLGVKIVAANLVFEDVWQDGDDIIFENQLKELGDYIIDNELWNDYSVRFFDPTIGFPITEEHLNSNFCGSGKMLAIDCDGNFYPCIRFLDFSLNNKKGRCIGNIYDGIDNDKLRPFNALTFKNQSDTKCISCDVASGCAWCTGNNYDNSCCETIFKKSTNNCNMHKANVKANKYFWDKFSQKNNLQSPREKYFLDRSKNIDNMSKFLIIMTSDNIKSHCYYNKKSNNDSIKMDRDTLEKGLTYAYNNGLIPVLLGESIVDDSDLINKIPYVIVSSSTKKYNDKNKITVFDEDSTFDEIGNEISILLVDKNNLFQLSDRVEKLLKKSPRVNIITKDIEYWENKDIDTYILQLEKINNVILDYYKNGLKPQINVLTDLMSLNTMENCDAGEKTFTLAPDGKFYICPAFYFDGMNTIGDLENGIEISEINQELFKIENAPICIKCDCYHCKRCKYLNKKMTAEYNIPSEKQCILSHIERNKARDLQILLYDAGIFPKDKIISKIEYLDPLNSKTLI